ncbi:MAG: SLC13 family permease [Pseudomonadota bacterium]
MELVFLALLIVLLALALGSGYPVAFALPGSAIITIVIAAGFGYLLEGNMDAFFTHGGPKQWLSAGVTNLRGIYWEVERDTLIAIPLFIFMGIMLQRSKIAEDLLVTMAQMFGPVPGGLGISVVFVGALLAATTGIVGATVVAMGLISLPVMLRNNYSPALATGTISASGTLGQIIPPSIVLIILADQLASATDQASTARKELYKASTGEISMPSAFDVSSTSAGEMFLGALVPGLVLVGLYMAYILIFSILRPKSAPSVRFDGAYDGRFWLKAAGTLVPPLTLIFLVLGSIITGIATVNQAGAIGAAGALLMAGYRISDGRSTYLPAALAVVSLIGIAYVSSQYDINVKAIETDHDRLGVMLAGIAVTGLIIALLWSGFRVARIDNTLNGVMIETAKATSLVFIILLGAAMLTAAFRAFGGEDLVRDFLNSLPGGFWTKFIIVMAVIFFLGFFLDFIEIAVVVVPIVAPILLADPGANVTAVWLGVMIGLNIQTSFLTPPFGFALFYLRGVAPPSVKTVDMYKGVIPFIGLQLLALAIVGNYPALVNYLPNRLSLTSETAPPPRNPKLQMCLEDYMATALNGDTGKLLDDAAQRAQRLDTSYLPKKMASELDKSLVAVDDARNALAAAFAASEAVQQAAPDYQPVQRVVRGLERELRELAEVRGEVETARSRADTDTARASLDERLATLDADRDALNAKIPAGWADQQAAFSDLLKAEAKTRGDYRKTVDKGYGAVNDLIEVLSSTEAFVALKPELDNMALIVETDNPKSLVDPLKALSKKFNDVEGASKIKSALSKTASEMKKRKPKIDKAMKQFNKAMELYTEQLAWRERATAELLPELQVYEAAMRDTLGVRQQRRLPHDQALYIARCTADHRDLSLNF